MWCQETETGKINPCVPKSNEELLAKLAKLSAGHVKIPWHCAKIPYRGYGDHHCHGSGSRELKEVFHQLGLYLPTEDELKRILAEAEACRRAQVTKEYMPHTQAELDVLIHQAEPSEKEVASRVHAEHSHGYQMSVGDQDLCCNYSVVSEPSMLQESL